MKPATLAVVLGVGLGGTLSENDVWPEFRGPSGTGHSDARGLPREWSESKNVVWKTPLHGRGWSSPVVWGRQVWLTTATPDGKELSVLCVDRETGRILVDSKIFEVARPDELWRKYNSYASPTPVIEEGRVYVNFGSYGTACLDTGTGQVLWSRRDLPCNHWRGAGSSPILHGDLLIIPFDGYDVQYVVALDKKTGGTVWKADRTHDFATDDGDLKKSFSTPIVIEVGGKPQLITIAAKAAVALDPATGREIWRVRYPNHSSGTRPLFGHGLVYITNGSPPAQLLAIRPDGTGDVTSTHVAWSWNRGVGQKPSPLLVGDLLFLLHDVGGLVTCVDARTGAEVWKQRLGGRHSASPLFVDGLVYVFGEDGVSVAFEPAREYREAARNRLAAGCMATPAIAGKAFYVRTETHLYRLEAR
jgi:outer membrane protein assembly factor BamB